MTGSEARILIETAHDTSVEVSVRCENESSAESSTNGGASHEDIRVSFKESQQKVAAKTPTAFVVSNLPPGQRIRVSVTLGSETREASFKTPAPGQDTW